MKCVRRVALAVVACLSLFACNTSGNTIAPVPAPQRTPAFFEPPVVRARNGIVSLRLTAMLNPKTGVPGISYDGALVPPTIELSPGDTIDLAYVNALPASSKPPTNMTNLHYHGFGSSPRAPGDDVLTMMADPGQTLHYRVILPKNQQPGLYWYHTHPHGQSNWQVESGLAGGIIVDGIDRQDPAVRGLVQRVVLLQDPQDTPDYGTLLRSRRHLMAMQHNVHPFGYHPCRAEDGRHVTVNGLIGAKVAIAPGEQQFFRVANISADRYFDLSVDGERIGLIAQDGYAVNTYPGEPDVVPVAHVLVPPAGRAEFIVTGLSHDTVLRSLCVDAGPDGDPDPNVALITLVSTAARASAMSPRVQAAARPLVRNPYVSTVLPPPAVKRLMIFSENPKTNQFYINGQQFSSTGPPMFVGRTGTVEQWRVENSTFEIHAFHIHQVHFLVESIDGVPVKRHQWLDTVNVPYATKRNGTIEPGVAVVLIDFLDPVIKGEFVFHCHILEHEDGGMMAKMEVL
ncbi:MAG: multicopper oxidase family protein [Candidatus Eremiobacteraeota bacterium]|nr:multicopper oxidase family protein [Candidatus Eremiobacteraeota bacterium]